LLLAERRHQTYRFPATADRFYRKNDTLLVSSQPKQQVGLRGLRISPLSGSEINNQQEEKTMPFFEEFVDAVTHYPLVAVQLSIVHLNAMLPAVGPAINANESWHFQVRVHNAGHLNMTNVSLFIEGQHGAKVRLGLLGAWVESIVCGALTINGHGQQADSPDLYFLAPNDVRPAGTTLVAAHIHRFDVNLNSILRDYHPVPAAPPSATFADEVFPA
jgi:hypothetical protein